MRGVGIMNAPCHEIRERGCRDGLDVGGWRIEWAKRPEKEDYDEDDRRAWEEAMGIEAAEVDCDCDYDDEDNI